MTDEPTPPPRLHRARRAVARSVEESPFAHPRTALVAFALICVLVLAGALLPVPYVIQRPGPAIDVLGEYQDEQILVIDGAETYPTDGELMMTTVSVDGGPGYSVTPAEVVWAWFDRSQAVLPREAVFPEGQTRQQTVLRNTAAMTTSQQGAVAVALDELGVAYETVVLIAGVEEDGPADGVLRSGDVVLAVDGRTAEDLAGHQSLIRESGADGSVLMTVQRGEEQLDLEIPAEDVDGAPRLGVVLSAGFDFPLEVEITVGDVGGPSAGMMFSLSVYDELTPGALTGGHSIAGTGTIALDGAVGSIGGIRQKLVGAHDSGAEFFLAPQDNCDQVVGFEPDGLQVVPVETFEEALSATESIAETGTAASLPTCEETL